MLYLGVRYSHIFQKNSRACHRTDLQARRCQSLNIVQVRVSKYCTPPVNRCICLLMESSEVSTGRSDHMYISFSSTIVSSISYLWDKTDTRDNGNPDSPQWFLIPLLPLRYFFWYLFLLFPRLTMLIFSLTLAIMLSICLPPLLLVISRSSAMDDEKLSPSLQDDRSYPDR